MNIWFQKGSIVTLVIKGSNRQKTGLCEKEADETRGTEDEETGESGPAAKQGSKMKKTRDRLNK